MDNISVLNNTLPDLFWFHETATEEITSDWILSKLSPDNFTAYLWGRS